LDDGLLWVGSLDELAMRKILPISPFFFWAVILFFLFAPLLVDASKAGASETLREKAKEELEAVKRDSQKIGKDAQQSAKEFSTQAGEEFKKTGKALKKTGTELKESATEAVQGIKELLRK
jgi:gas vesicle protein